MFSKCITENSGYEESTHNTHYTVTILLIVFSLLVLVCMQIHTKMAMHNNWIISLSIDHMNSFIELFSTWNLTACMLIQWRRLLIMLLTFSHDASGKQASAGSVRIVNCPNSVQIQSTCIECNVLLLLGTWLPLPFRQFRSDRLNRVTFSYWLNGQVLVNCDCAVKLQWLCS